MLGYETIKGEAQSVFADDPPTHHHAAQTDRTSPPLLLSILNLHLLSRNWRCILIATFS